MSICGILLAFTSRASGKSPRVRLPKRTGALDRHFAHWSSKSTRWHRISQRSSLAGQFSNSLASATFRRPPHCSAISQTVAIGNRVSGRHIDRNCKVRTNVRNYSTVHYTARDTEYKHSAQNTQTRCYKSTSTKESWHALQKRNFVLIRTLTIPLRRMMCWEMKQFSSSRSCVWTKSSGNGYTALKAGFIPPALCAVP